MILKTDNITMQFGGVTAVNLLNIEINEHENDYDRGRS